MPILSFIKIKREEVEGKYETQGGPDLKGNIPLASKHWNVRFSADST